MGEAGCGCMQKKSEGCWLQLEDVGGSILCGAQACHTLQKLANKGGGGFQSTVNKLPPTDLQPTNQSTNHPVCSAVLRYAMAWCLLFVFFCQVPGRPGLTRFPGTVWLQGVCVCALCLRVGASWVSVAVWVLDRVNV